MTGDDTTGQSLLSSSLQQAPKSDIFQNACVVRRYTTI
jgi:hypothetical protein